VGAAAVVVADKLVEAICGTALALGVWSLRPSMMALRVARLAAALAGRETATAGDATLAVRLVLAPRATRMPQRHEPAPEEQPDPPPSERQPDEPNSDEQPSDEPPSDAPNPADPPPAQDQDIPAGELAEILLAAAKSAIPAGLLDLLKAVAPQRARGSGTSGAMQKAGARGRPAGIRRALPQHGARLNLVETLRAAAPWQRLRQRETGETSRIQVRADDFHVTRHRPRTETTTIFAVDASGSSAAARLAEAKGAVELLLADCYVRRDSVAVIGFRGKTASILLPPTRSLVRAKRALAGLPGGGGTPIAAGLDCAAALAEQVRQRGQTPTIVMLTDGRANVGRDGLGGRAKAQEEALAAAAALRASGTACLLVDISPRPAPQGQMLADAMGARYVALPYADANLLSQAVRVAIGS
jgi:magnesium chelatase subunit D